MRWVNKELNITGHQNNLNMHCLNLFRINFMEHFLLYV